MNSIKRTCYSNKVARHTNLSRLSPATLIGDVRSQPVLAWLTVIGIVAVAALLRLFMLSSQSLWLDEGASLAMTDSGNTIGTLEALLGISGGDKYQLVYFLLLSHWRSWVGDSQFYLQSLSVIPGILTPLLVYLAVKALLGVRHAVCAAVFVTFSAYCISFSQEVRPYAFLLCVASLHLLTMTPVLKGSENLNIHRWFFALVTLIATLSSIFLMFFIAALAMAHLTTYLNVRSWISWWFPSVLFSIPALLYYSGTPARTNLTADAVNNAGIPLWENMVYAVYSHLAGQTYGPAVNALRGTESSIELLAQHALSLSVLGLVALVMGWYVIQALRKPVAQHGQNTIVIFFVALFVLSFGAAAAFAYLTSINWMPRHSFYLMLPISVLVSVSVVQSYYSTVGAQKSMLARVPVVFYPALLAINLFSSYQSFFHQEHLLDDYRSAASFLADNVSEEDASLVLWGEPYLLSYYGHTHARGLWRLENPSLIMSKIEEAALTNDSVFITINREANWKKYSQVLSDQLNQSYNLVPKAQFTNFSIYRIEKGITELSVNEESASLDVSGS